MIEIEKSFLVKSPPQNLASFKSENIKQGYLSVSKTPLRIRQKGKKFELTKKFFLKPNDFSLAEEITISITEEEFKKLWTLVEKSLEKDRYFIPLGGGLMAELDIFKGKLKGLVLVEVEFKSEDRMKSFKKPDWFGKDVTQEEYSSNVILAGKSFKDISGKI